MTRPIALATCLALTALVAAERDARADITVQGSVGTALIIGGTADRGPVTFEVGPGYQLAIFRIELPVVLGVADGNVFPPASSGFLGLRPSLKVFPFDPFYAKLSTQLFFEGDHYGLGIGGGVEWTFFDLLGAFGEVTVNPYFEGGDGVPVEFRAGATLIF